MQTDNSNKLIRNNTIINLVGQSLPLIVGIVTIPIIINHLGADRFGVLTLAWMIIGYFSLFDLGLGRALTQIVANRLGGDTECEIPALVWTSFIIMGGMGLIGAIICALISPVLVANVFKMSDNLKGETLISFYILSATIPAVILSAAFVGVLSAYQRFDLINFVRVPLGLANFLAPLVVFFYTSNLIPIIIILALCRLLAAIAQYRLCIKIMPAFRKNKLFESSQIHQLFRFGGWMTVSNIVGPLMIYLDRFIIGSVISVVAVAYYATPYEIITKLWIISGSLIATLFPAFATLKNSTTNKTVELLEKSLGVILAVLFPVIVIVSAFSGELLNIWIGTEFSLNSSVVLKWLTLGVFIHSFAQVLYALVQARGRPDLTAKFHLVELVIYLPILWWMLNKYGIQGAAAAWTFRILMDTCLLLWATSRLILNVNALLIKILIFGMISIIAILVCNVPEGIIMRATIVFIFALAYLMLLIKYYRRYRLTRDFT